jgi:hypothetical protein
MFDARIALAALVGGAAASPPGLHAFSNDTAALWHTTTTSGSAGKVSPNYVLLRPPTLRLMEAPAGMAVLVSAAPDPVNQGQLLGRYRLFVNGVHVAVGPGRSDRNLIESPADAAFDRVTVPAAALAAGANSGRS